MIHDRRPPVRQRFSFYVVTALGLVYSLLPDSYDDLS